MKKILLALLIIIIFSVLGFTYVFIPHLVAARNAVSPFEFNQQLLCDKITYLLRDPVVGDRIIFSGMEMLLVGVVDDFETQDGTKRYFISSTNSGKHWNISSEEINCHVWYPIL